jgi:hypothetical protein
MSEIDGQTLKEDLESIINQGTSDLDWESRAYNTFLGDVLKMLRPDQRQGVYELMASRIEDSESEEGDIFDNTDNEDFQEAKSVVLWRLRTCA